MENGKVLGDKLQQAERYHKMALQNMMDCNKNFRALDRDLNSIRPILMRLQWEKDQYIR